MSSSYTYTDKVASLVQEAAYLQDNLSNQEGETASTPVSHIDGEDLNVPVTVHSFTNMTISLFTMCDCHWCVVDVIDMLDVIMEGTDGEMQEFGPPLSEELILQTFPFSVFVPAALEARNKLPANKGTVLNK